VICCARCLYLSGAKHEALYFVRGDFLCEKHAKNTWLRKILRFVGLAK
jgi:hypothetical protein